MKAPSLLVNIDVSDLQKAEAFYTQAFDLKPVRRFGQGGVELGGLNASIFLLVKKEGSIPFQGALPAQGRSYSRHWCPVHLDFIVESIDVAIKQACDAGATQESEIRHDNWGKIALFSDPFGNGFCLIEFVGRGYDEIAS